MDFIDRLDYALKDKKMTAKELTEAVGIGKTAVNDWRRGKSTPSPKILIGISHALETSIDWLLTGKEDEAQHAEPITIDERLLLDEYNDVPQEKKVDFHRKIKQTKAALLSEDEEEPEQVEVKVFDMAASAGMGNYLGEEEPYTMITVDADEVPKQASFGIRIDGDSMEPDIKHGSIVWVQERLQIENGEIGIFILDDSHKALCKKLFINHPKRRIELVSLNAKYENIIVNEGEYVRTVGKVLL